MNDQTTQLFPNLFLVGASKAGTTSIAEALGRHNEIFMTHPKEPNFFNQYDEPESISDKQLINYLKLYSNVTNEKIVGEASVGYLDSVNAAKHIYNFNKNSKILISLRNPLTRITSLYDMYVRLGLEQDFDLASVEDPWLTRQCYYYEKIKRYIDTFDMAQILILDFEDLKNDWNGTLTSIFSFLGVDISESNNPIVRNTGGIPKNSVYKVLTNRKLINIGKKMVPENIRNYVDLKIKKSVFVKTKLEKYQKEQLLDIFKHDVSKLDELLDTDYKTKWLNL